MQMFFGTEDGAITRCASPVAPPGAVISGTGARMVVCRLAVCLGLEAEEVAVSAGS